MQCEWVLSKFNGTPTPKGSHRAKTGDNDSNVNSSGYSLSTALCESIRCQGKSEQNVQQDLIPRVRHGEAALCTPTPACTTESNLQSVIWYEWLKADFKPDSREAVYHVRTWNSIICPYLGRKLGWEQKFQMLQCAVFLPIKGQNRAYICHTRNSFWHTG